MKNLITALIIIPFLYSCQNSENKYSEMDINTIEFYNYKGEKISKDDIIGEWNKRLQKEETLNVTVKNIEIKYLSEESTNEEKIALIGNTNKNSTKTATELVEYEEGLKLSERVTTCSNCENDDLNMGIKEGYWYCKSIKENSDCTKISTLQYD
jgi:hypothetical protein